MIEKRYLRAQSVSVALFLYWLCAFLAVVLPVCLSCTVCVFLVLVASLSVLVSGVLAVGTYRLR